MISDYPSVKEELNFPSAERNMEIMLTAIRAIRTRRNEMNVPPSRKAKVYIATKYPESFPAASAVFFQRLASASEVEVADTFEGRLSADETVQIVTDAATILLPLSDIIDTEKEKARLSTEKTRLEGEIVRIEKKLANEGFVAKAPAAVIEGERAKLKKYLETREALNAALAKLK